MIVSVADNFGTLLLVLRATCRKVVKANCCGSALDMLRACAEIYDACLISHETFSLSGGSLKTP